MADSGSETGEVGSRLPLATIAAAAVSLLVLLGGIALWRSVRSGGEIERLVIATGPHGGAYHALGESLGRLLEEEGVVPEVEVHATEGSGENVELMSSGQADLALVQSDTDTPEEARLLARVFEEALHVLVSRRASDDVASIMDLDGRRLSLGGASSGTRQVAQRVLDHFDVEPAVDLDLDPATALSHLEAGELDAVFLLTAVPAVSIEEIAGRDVARFLSLGDAQEVGNEADGLVLVFPQLHATNIPRGTYGPLPQEPVRTVGVWAQLIGSEELSEGLVRRMLETVYTGRVRLDDADHALSFGERLREYYEPGQVLLNYHPGAHAYYERDEPSFVVAYAEPISLGLTLLVGVWSASLALRQWLQRSRKNRIDAYYVEVVRDAPDLVSADAEMLRERRRRLLRVRESAFTDLVEERLEADESFSIFQSQIDGEIASIERRLGQSRELT